jgi:hypothetical protein
MIGQDPERAVDTPASEHDDPRLQPAGNDAPPQRGQRVEEFGGRPGPEPTRYGDWEKNGRCIDF